MLHFCLENPVDFLFFGEFISPEENWKHLSRRLFEYEMMIVTEGTLCIADSDCEYTIPAGEYLIMSPTRRQHGTRTCRCRFYWLHFRCPALPVSVSLPAQGKYRDRGAIEALARMLFESESHDPRGVRSRYLATQLLLELAASAGGEQHESPAPPRRRLCERIRTFVFFHRFSDLKVRDVARELGYHEKYLSAVFHETEGVTLKHYIDEARLREAQRMLLETDYTVAAVAYYLNFPSPHNFARFFKAKTGMTAGEYREHVTRRPPQEDPAP